MKLAFTTFSLACLFLLAACLTPSMEQLASKDHGPPPPENYQEQIKAQFARVFFNNPLFGSYQPIYEFNLPVKGYTKGSHLRGTREIYGWVVCGTVTRKKRFAGYGGYIGPIPFFVMFKNGELVDEFIGQKADDREYDLNRFNAQISEVCDRKPEPPAAP